MKLSKSAALQAAIRLDAAPDVVERITADREMLNHVFPCTHHTPLSLAASEGHLETVARLLDLGATPQPSELYPVTAPLHEAARRGHALVALALLEAGADPARPDLSGLTPLDLAAINGHPDTLRSLILDVTPQDRRRHDGACATALYHAACRNDGQTVNYLQRFGVPINVYAAMAMGDLGRMTADCRTGWDPLSMRHPAHNKGVVDGALPLHQALAERDHSAVLELLRLGADPCAKSLSGLSTLAISAAADALAAHPPEQHHEVLASDRRKLDDRTNRKAAEMGMSLIGEKAPSEKWNPEKQQSTPLLLKAGLPIDPAAAVALGEMELLAEQCLEIPDPAELVPALCLASWLGVEDAVERLLNAGVPPDAELPGRPGMTALRLALQGPSMRRTRRSAGPTFGQNKVRTRIQSEIVVPDRARIASLLLSHGARDQGGAALTDAIKAHCDHLALALLQHPDYVSADPCDPLGRATATAILLSTSATLNTLLEHGADPNRPIEDLGGMRPVHVALAWHKANARTFVGTLMSHGADLHLKDPVFNADSLAWAQYGCWPKAIPLDLTALLSRG